MEASHQRDDRIAGNASLKSAGADFLTVWLPRQTRILSRWRRYLGIWLYGCLDHRKDCSCRSKYKLKNYEIYLILSLEDMENVE